jgi:hypothetical protein
MTKTDATLQNLRGMVENGEVLSLTTLMLATTFKKLQNQIVAVDDSMFSEEQLRLKKKMQEAEKALFAALSEFDCCLLQLHKAMSQEF